MDRKIILVVDRDDDFGEKAGVATPVIGIDACLEAAQALAVADPEDSDTNALYAAVKIYKEMKADKTAPDVEIALICGDKNVGYHSDEALTDELEIVMSTCSPKGAILVGDGAEDEYIYPIISSRLHIDSVRKVYVTQTPGVEGTVYIISKYLKDPAKKKRFGTPIAVGILQIQITFLIANFLVYEDPKEFFIHSTTAIIVAIFGILMLCFAFSVWTKVDELVTRLRTSAKEGPMIVFIALAVLFVVFGIIVALYSFDQVYTSRFTEQVVVFVANALWPVLFAIMILDLGLVVSQYLAKKTFRIRNITGSLYVLSAGVVITAFLDFFMEYTGIYPVGTQPIIMELAAGFVLFIIAIIVHGALRRLFASRLAGPGEE